MPTTTQTVQTISGSVIRIRQMDKPAEIELKRSDNRIKQFDKISAFRQRLHEKALQKKLTSQ